MQSTIKQGGALVTGVKQLVKSKIALFRFEIAERISSVFADMAGILILCLFVFAFSLFIGFGFALVIWQWSGNPWLGFFVVGVLFMVKGIVIWNMRGRIIQLPIFRSLMNLKKSSNEQN